MAGASLAWMLARDGVDVLLVDDGRAVYSGLYETVLAQTRGTWERLGLLDAVARGFEQDPMRHGAIWGDDALVWRDDEDGGLLIHRGVFDEQLRLAAAVAGAKVVFGHQAKRTARGWVVAGERVEPATTVFATGRRQGVTGLQSSQRGDVRTVAVNLQGEPGEGDRGVAVVEALPQGWVWYSCPPEGSASLCALLDAGPGLGTLRSAVAEMVATARGPAAYLQQWRIARANDASPRRREALAGCLVIGDAAGTIDPLASQGVEKAVSAAEQAAVAVRTALRNPEWWDRICRAHAAWEHDLCAAHWRVSEAFYGMERRFLDEPFWRRRASAAALFADAGAPDGGVPLEWRRGLQRGPALIRHGAEYVEVDGLRCGVTGDELARVGRLSSASLFDAIPNGLTLEQALRRVSADPRFVTSSAHEVQTALERLYAKGWLVNGPRSEPAGR